MKKIIAVASGKGGVGKTCIALNLSMALSRLGNKVCLFDADLGLANVNILIGAHPSATFHDLLFGSASLVSIKLNGPDGVTIIPGGSGFQELTEVDSERYREVADEFEYLNSFDYLIVDTSAGISPANLALARAADMTLVIFTPEPTSVTDGFAVVKILSLSGYKGEFRTVFNQFKSEAAAKKGAEKLDLTAQKYLKLKLPALPPVLHDDLVRTSVLEQTPFLRMDSFSAASAGIMKVAAALDDTGANGAQASSAVDYIYKVAKYAANKKLFSLVAKVNDALGRKSGTQTGATPAPAPGHQPTEQTAPAVPASAPAPSTAQTDPAVPEQAVQPAQSAAESSIAPETNGLAKIFEKNIQIQEKMLIALERMNANGTIAHHPHEPSGQTNGETAPDENKANDRPTAGHITGSYLLDFDAYLDNDSEGSVNKIEQSSK